MLERPNLSDEAILSGLREGYGIPATGVTFLPIGNDSTAWVYRVATDDGASYFLKVRRGEVDPASLIVPRTVRDQGMTQAVAPLPARCRALSVLLDPFTLILYPFIEGEDGVKVGLTGAQWVEYGDALRRLHATPFSDALRQLVRREDFRPRWRETVLAVMARVAAEAFSNPYQCEMAAFLRPRHDEILKLTARAIALGDRLHADPPEFVLCHADIHTANILVSPQGTLHMVDWDNPVLAPKERYLMFVVGDASTPSEEERLFFEGYGPTQVDALALAYYRYEWVVQEIGDYAARVFMPGQPPTVSPDATGAAETGEVLAGETTKRDAVAGLMQLFDPGDVVDAAYASERERGV